MAKEKQKGERKAAAANRARTESFRQTIHLRGLAVAGALGIAGGFLPLGDGLRRLSYDLLYRHRDTASTADVVLVVMDETSEKELGVAGGPWPRRLHADLLGRLQEDGAKLVYFDILFDVARTRTPEETVDDAAFVEAVAAFQREGESKVILGAAVRNEVVHGSLIETIVPPFPALADAAGDGYIGMLELAPVEPDLAVRRLAVGNRTFPSGAWRAAQVLGSPAVEGGEELRRRMIQRPVWLNYPGPAGHIPEINFHRALDPVQAGEGFFRDKVVVVGGKYATGSVDGRDTFRSPFWVVGSPLISGVEIHAVEVVNLLESSWLNPMPAWQEALVAAAYLGLLALVLCSLPPLVALLAGTPLAMVGFSLAAVKLCWGANVTFSWLAPIVLITPAALVWSIGYRAHTLALNRAQMLKILGNYVSPSVALRLAKSGFNPDEIAESKEAVTVLMADIENYTGLAEKITDPDELVKILNLHYESCTDAIFDQSGTIIAFLGDAVMAVWGAPEDDPSHARKAVEAAWELDRAAGRKDRYGHEIRMRIGISSGAGRAGNLGGSQRFDYTVVGDNTNTAARLEGLNKLLGTRILIGGTTRAALGDAFATRYVGRFVLKGKSEPTEVHEVLGPAGEFDPVKEIWTGTFADALEAFAQGKFERADEGFGAVEAARGESGDGPSAYYREEIAKLRDQGGPAAGWDGTIRLDSK